MNDTTFIQKLNANDRGAFHLVYTNYYKMLVVYAIGFVKEQEVAEDLVQELIISIWEQDNNFQHINAFKSYLYNSVKNKCLNYIKHQSVKDRYAQTIKAEQPFNLHIEEDDTEEQELYRQLFMIVDQLPQRCKQVFELQMQGKKNKEIAEVLNISIETVKTQKKRALKKLKEQLGNTSILLLF